MKKRKTQSYFSETNTLVFPLNHFQTLLRMLAEEENRIVFCFVGISRLSKETRYLVRRVESTRAQQVSERDIGRSLCVSTTTQNAPKVAFQLQTSPVSGALGHLILGHGALQGQWWGMLTTSSGAAEALHRIVLVGAGMHELKALSSSFEKEQESDGVPIPIDKVYSRLSRTIGALGARYWRRLVSLHIAIVGCGRSGSIVAVMLARLGVKCLTLIDPDVVEEHNLPEMDGIGDADVGRLKVEALADFLQTHCASADTPLSITTIPEPITAAHHAALDVDVLFCCVDNDSARLACGILATLFHKVLIDIGTGIFNESNSARTMGTDVRLILPATGCLRCFGSVANYDEGIKNLIECNLSGENGREQEQWWLRRSGSLRTLNMMAVSVGVQLLCDLIAERVHTSRWVRMEYDDSGILTVKNVSQNPAQATPSCPLCAKAGLGDEGLLWDSQSSTEKIKEENVK